MGHVKEHGVLSMRLQQVQTQSQVLTLSQVHQIRLGGWWDRVLSEATYFVPGPARGRFGKKEAQRESRRLGRFAVEHLIAEINSDIRTHIDAVNRLVRKGVIVAVGYGRGYDSQWMEEALAAGFRVLWLDVSQKAVVDAILDLSEQYSKVLMKFSKERAAKTAAGRPLDPKIKGRPAPVIPPAPHAIQAEIRSALLEPEAVQWINFSEVLEKTEMLYFCRTIAGLNRISRGSRNSAKIVLQRIGHLLSSEKDLDKRKKVVIVEPLSEYNPGQDGLLSKKMIVSNIRRGAGRPIRIKVASEKFFGVRVYTVLTITAR